MLARVRQLALQRLTLISHSNIRFAATVPSTNVPVNVRKEDLVDADKSEFLQPVSMEDLPRAQKRYAKQFEQINMVRTKEIFRKNYRNIATLCVLALVAISIYAYTCLAVKQETFLEEIDQEMQEEAPQKNS